ncbi:MAG TPA: hypothetical protein VI299_25585 [Polyangiales bacterium]
MAVFTLTYLVSGCGNGVPDLTPKEDLISAGDASTKSDAARADAGAKSGDSSTPGGDANANGLPCDVDALLQKSCRSCHGSKPIGGAPMSLVTYEDLAATSLSDPTLNYGEQSLASMQDGSMPVAKPLAASAYAPFAAWVQAGMPRGSCGSDAGTGDPYDTPVTCSSNKRWTGGNRESPLMHPGGTCIDCHTNDEGPRFSIAGTVYLTAHEPDDCNGSNASGVTLEITDANGKVHTLKPNGAGNFYLETSIPKPYTAELLYEGRARAMATPQQNGDCNSCHTQDGAEDAPGRIMLP